MRTVTDIEKLGERTIWIDCDVLEADGAVKYNDRPDADTIVTLEKERERLLRRAGFGVVRYTFADAVNRPDIIVERARQAALLRPAGPAPTCWAMDPPWGDSSILRAVP